MMYDVPASTFKPRIERERIIIVGLFKDLPNGSLTADIFGDWIVTYLSNSWTFQSWAVAVEFVMTGGHLHMTRKESA